MTDDRSKMRDGDMPLLDRIESAMRRVTSGQGQMRVPVEATDPDVVLADCKREIERLRRENMAPRSLPDKPHIVLDKDALDWLDAADEAMHKEGTDAR